MDLLEATMRDESLTFQQKRELITEATDKVLHPLLENKNQSRELVELSLRTGTCVEKNLATIHAELKRLVENITQDVRTTVAKYLCAYGRPSQFVEFQKFFAIPEETQIVYVYFALTSFNADILELFIEQKFSLNVDVLCGPLPKSVKDVPKDRQSDFTKCKELMANQGKYPYGV